jgi:hypothetical protein
MNTLGGTGLWDEEDGFYYDRLRADDGPGGEPPSEPVPLRARSLVGLVPLLAVEVIEQDVIKALPGFRKRMRWFLDNRPELARQTSYMERITAHGHELRLLAIPSKERLLKVLRRLLDENEFLSQYGVRSLSKAHANEMFCFLYSGGHVCIQYEPGESTDGLWGGNSNWRGPIWFPLNYLLIEALERYHLFYGDSVTVEMPVGSGVYLNLAEVATELARRLGTMFLPDAQNRRPCHGSDGAAESFANDPHWQDLIWFHEYFHAESGRGLGANHQTGWTALVTRCLNLVGRVSGGGGGSPPKWPPKHGVS